MINILKRENKQLQHEIKAMKQCRFFEESDELNEFNELKHGVELMKGVMQNICISLIPVTIIIVVHKVM